MNGLDDHIKFMVKAYNPKILFKAYKLAINFETCSKTYKKPFKNMDKTLKAKTNTPNFHAHNGKWKKLCKVWKPRPRVGPTSKTSPRLNKKEQEDHKCKGLCLSCDEPTHQYF
jgi:hypothetical protein